MAGKNKTVWLLVPAEVPEDFDESIDLAKFLNIFVAIGLSDLRESVKNEDIETTEEAAIVSAQVKWGEPTIEVKF